MNKKWFIIIIILMAFSLVGIIFIQLYWIRNAIQVKEAQFDQNVNLAMKEMAEGIEERENVILLSDQLKNFERTLVRKKQKGNDTISTSITVGSEARHRVNILRENDNDTDFDTESDIYVWESTVDTEGEHDLVMITGDNEFTIQANEMNIDLKYRYDLDYDSIKRTIQTIKGYYDVDTLSNVLFNSFVYSVEAGDSNQYFIVSKPNIKATKAERLGQVFERMVIEAEDLAMPIEELYSLDDLHYQIRNALWGYGIDQEFEFGIESADDTNNMPLKSRNFDFDQVDNAYRVDLFPEEIYKQKDYQLFIEFPKKSLNLIKSISLLLSASGLLTLIIMLTFGITIYMILRQKRISDIKSDFINNMTHEFKTPIATISLAVDSINNPKTLEKPDNILYYTGIIKEENKRMNAQVENVLQMSLLDKHELEFNMQPYDLHDLIRNAIHKISLQIEERKGKIEVKLDALHHMAMVDEGHFTNAMLNLLDNANKYSPEAPEITVSTANIGAQISLKISDQGIGMSKDIQKKIFEKFYRQASGNIHNVKGFGLGLAYVRAILQVIKGKIKIYSEPGKGSTFELIIPTLTDHE